MFYVNHLLTRVLLIRLLVVDALATGTGDTFYDTCDKRESETD